MKLSVGKMRQKMWNMTKYVDMELTPQMSIEDAQKIEESTESIEENEDNEFIDFYSDEELERELDEDVISGGEAAFSTGYLHALD